MPRLNVVSTDFAANLGTWRFHTAAPGSDLADIVVELWEVEGQLVPFREKVLPNGCLEVMINLGPVHHLVTEDGGVQAWERSWLSGLHERAITIESEHGTHLLSARLRAVHARRVIGGAMHRTGNAVLDLESLMGAEAAHLRTALLADRTVEARLSRLDEFIRKRVAASAPTDVRVEQVARAIEASHGCARLTALCREARVSRKHLAALFAAHLGVSPKTYARIERFAWVLRRIQESESVDWSALALEAGYSDQSHLVRDFQRVASATPTSFLRTRTPDGSALVLETG